MGNFTRQIRTELKQIPLMLGKLFGGLAAVFGVTTTVLIITRRPDASSLDVLPPLLVAGSGIAVFLLSNKKLARYSSVAAEEALPDGKKRMSALSWLLFLLFAGIFIACVYFLAG